MDETARQVINQEPVQGQIVANYGTINIQFGDSPEGKRQSSTTNHIWYVPYPRNPLFTGRDLVLRQLHERLSASKNIALTQPQAISGLGGIGKTQVAVEYAYRYHKEYNIVLCIRADTQDTIRTDFSTIADTLRLPESKEQDQQVIVNAIKIWLVNQSNWLLILDNADDLDLIRDFIPSSKNSAGHILLTTQSRATSKMASNILVEKMSLKEG